MSQVPADVHATVTDFLADLEREYAAEHDLDITFVLAVSRGSHAWGLDGPESDYDVAVVYAPSDLREYAHLGGTMDSIQRDYPGPLDVEVQGWDVRTFGTLLSDSNEQAIDALRSPITYRECFDREPLREYVLESYNPIALYHTYRAIAKNNYRKYLSHHLVDSDTNTYRIDHVTDDRFVLEDPLPDGRTELAEADVGGRYQETQARQTVKRNLAVAKNAMYAEYLRVTGECGEHRLPHYDFPTFLAEQAPAVFDDDLLGTVSMLVAEKQAGNGSSGVGDLVGHEFAHRPADIPTAVHATGDPDETRLNDFIDDMLDAI